MTITVVPAILPESLDDLRTQLEKVRGVARRVQIDVVDGVFAPRRTWPLHSEDQTFFKKLIDEEEGMPMWEDFDFEIDMMLHNPEKFVECWGHAGADTVILHVGSSGSLTPAIEKARESNLTVGIAIRPSIKPDEYLSYIEHVDFVQCMGNDHIGDHGMPLDEKVYTILKELHALFPEKPLAVDIGVTEETAPRLIAAGATKLVAGSAIFESENLEETIEMLESSDTQ